MPFVMRVKSGHDKPRGWRPAADRRQEGRRAADRREAVSAQLLGGVDVKLCNVSTRGVMFESSMRVLVGSQVTLRLRTASSAFTLPGEVVRSRVSATRHGRLRYETAVALSADCPLSSHEMMLTPQTELVTVLDEPAVDAQVLTSVSVVNDW